MKSKKKPSRILGITSIEKLTHFSCGKCKKWWSIGDAPKQKGWFCPWCGTKQGVSLKGSR